MKPYIITTGANGRAVIFGWSKTAPKVGKPHRLERAKMVVRWTRQGLFGLAANGPLREDRITKAVQSTTVEVVRQVLEVAPEVGAKIDEWAPWQG